VKQSIASCGILAILRKPHADKIKGSTVVDAIDLVRFRGSRYGAGYAVMNMESRKFSAQIFLIKDGREDDRLNLIIEELSKISNIECINKKAETEKVLDIEIILDVDKRDTVNISRRLLKINDKLWKDGKSGRVYSWGWHIEVFKGVGYPRPIADLYNIYEWEGDLWIAHTRQPTNSPGYYPYWSHPFSLSDIAVVHNGDISSFGSNMNFLRYSLDFESFVGTDSECIAFITYKLVREDGLDPETLAKLLVGSEESELALKYLGVRLDGPFAIAIGLYYNDDLYLIAAVDRQKLRPIVIGEDENYYYVASEECQIRRISPNARVWTLQPGGYFIVSMNRGILKYGRPSIDIEFFYDSTNSRISKFMYIKPPPEDDVIDAWGLSYRELNRRILEKALKGYKRIRVYNVYGQRYIGINISRHGIRGVKLEIYGIPGNCLGNLNMDTEIIVYGNVEDDVGDTMHGGSIVVYGDARDVVGQALQGGYIFIRGNAGTRVGILMREYVDKRPYLIVGGRVDKYLGEYMAGGVAMVLGIEAFRNRVEIELADKHVGTGMVGGRIYIRGRISPHKIGLRPPKLEFINFIEGLIEEKLIPTELVQDIEYGDIETLEERLIKYGNELALKLAKTLYESKHIIKIVHEYRELNQDEIRELRPVLLKYAEYFSIDSEEIDDLLSEKYTVVYRYSRR